MELRIKNWILSFRFMATLVDLKKSTLLSQNDKATNLLKKIVELSLYVTNSIKL